MPFNTNLPIPEAVKAARIYLNSIRGDLNPEIHTATHFNDFAKQQTIELSKALEKALDYIDGMTMGIQMAAGKVGEIKPDRSVHIVELHDILAKYK